MMLEKVKFADLDKYLSNYSILYVEFYTSWCGDCKMMEPVIQSVAQDPKMQNLKNFKMIQIDAEEANLFRDANSKYKILKVPTHLVFKNGQEVLRSEKFFPKEFMIEWIESVVD